MNAAPRPQPRMDPLHKGLALAAALLLGCVLFGYASIVKHQSESWLASLEQVQERAGTNIALHDQLVALQPPAADDEDASADATADVLASFEPAAVADSAEAAELRVRIDEARRLYYRDVMRAADRERELRDLVGLRWIVWGACLLALVATLIGWARWMKAFRTRER